MTPMVVLSKLGVRKHVPDIGTDMDMDRREGRGGTSLVMEVEEETTPVVVSKQRRRATSGFATLMKKMKNLRRMNAKNSD